MIVKKCLLCGKEFKCRGKLREKTGKYCSYECMGKAYKNNTPWNKEERIIKKCYTCKKEFLVSPYYIKQGRKFCSLRCFYIFKKTINKNENNYNWKGDKVGYVGLHAWIRRILGKPTKCEQCGKEGLKNQQINWANKSGEYKRDLSDWLRLCVKCHRGYDKQQKLLKELTI